jgi:hypothetical protein
MSRLFTIALKTATLGRGYSFSNKHLLGKIKDNLSQIFYKMAI